MSAKRNNCRYALPHELTGIGECCGLFGNVCNGYGKRCLGYQPHDEYTRKTLANAIAEKRKQKQKETDDEVRG